MPRPEEKLTEELLNTIFAAATAGLGPSFTQYDRLSILYWRYLRNQRLPGFRPEWRDPFRCPSWNLRMVEGNQTASRSSPDHAWPCRPYRRCAHSERTIWLQGRLSHRLSAPNHLSRLFQTIWFRLGGRADQS